MVCLAPNPGTDGKLWGVYIPGTDAPAWAKTPQMMPVENAAEQMNNLDSILRI
jgi:hypothetical protein